MHLNRFRNVFQRPPVVLLEHSHTLSLTHGPPGAASAPRAMGTKARRTQTQVFTVWASERKQVISSREETKGPSRWRATPTPTPTPTMGSPPEAAGVSSAASPPTRVVAHASIPKEGDFQFLYVPKPPLRLKTY